MKFNSFVIFAEMRTGSNFLETNLNALGDISSHGEAFNPAFIGFPKSTKLFGLSKLQRNQAPETLLDRIKSAPGLNGFRYFSGHDPRVLDLVMDEKSWAKIILTRNPIDSFVSLKIARETGQWKLTNAKMAKKASVEFDAAEFETYLEEQQAFQLELQHGLQRRGQTAFYIGYDDLQDLDILNGLAKWLGSKDRLEKLDQGLKPQNPKPIAEKLSNSEQISESLARLDRFNLARTPNFEPRRGPRSPTYVAAARTPLLYQGISGGPRDAVTSWLARLDDTDIDQLQLGFTQSELRQWFRSHPRHRSFTVLRHPLARAHAAFCEKIIPSNEDGSYQVLREHIRTSEATPLPSDLNAAPTEHRKGFEGFLSFLTKNLAGQTSVRIDPWWCAQVSIVAGFSGLRPPDAILREETLGRGLASLSLDLGLDDMPSLPATTDAYAARLSSIYDKDLEKLARKIYNRDYQTFGFGNWR